MDISTTAESAKPTSPATSNEAYVKFCEIAKEIGVSDETIDLIKKDLKMVDDDAATEPEVTGKPEVKVAEVTVDKAKVSPIMDMITNMIKTK